MTEEGYMRFPMSADGAYLRPGDRCYIKTGNRKGWDIYERLRIDAVDYDGVWFGGRRQEAAKVYFDMPDTMDGLKSAMGEMGLTVDQLDQAMMLLDAAHRLGAEGR